ncbi:ciliary microtubule associated protein 1A-like [Lineus longissimus]|uniref:ciliary microtubule associated protein 1A-like n=1 Tax=Lineus longissimus TaxID=88925 RepID=UPI002B4F587B
MPAAKEDVPKEEYPKIEAMERGPGPGRYRLPPQLGHLEHDTRRNRAPAYSFGIKTSPYSERTPGPSYSIDSALTRFGRDGTFRYSMLGRHALTKAYNTPAPGAYNPEHVIIDKGSLAPKYSLSHRTNLRRADKIPAPNSYNIPSMVGPVIPTRRGGPAFSMGKRLDHYSSTTDLAKTPGPAAYMAVDPTTNKSKPSEYSMQGRTKPLQDKTNVPGPGAYNPENVNINKPHNPKFTMGIRHSQYLTPLIVEVSD